MHAFAPKKGSKTRMIALMLFVKVFIVKTFKAFYVFSAEVIKYNFIVGIGAHFIDGSLCLKDVFGCWLPFGDAVSRQNG